MKTTVVCFLLSTLLIFQASSYRQVNTQEESNKLFNRVTVTSFLERFLAAAAAAQGTARSTLRSGVETEATVFAPQLIDPWLFLLREFNNTFGVDPAVTFPGLDTSRNPYILPIVTDNKKKGMALRTIIPVNFPFGNINVVTTVNNSKGDIWEAIIIQNEKQLLEVIVDAFSGNPLFVEAKPRVLPPNFHQVGLIMTKSLVQFPSDNIFDYYFNFNGVTAQVVDDLIHMLYVNNTVQIVMGTAKSKGLQSQTWSSYNNVNIQEGRNSATARYFLKHVLEAAATIQGGKVTPKLTPLWYTLQSKFNNTFGFDPAVTVHELDTSRNPYTLTLVTDSEKKGTALRAIIPINFRFGKINVATTVNDSKGDIWGYIFLENKTQVSEVVMAAFAGNPLFEEVKSTTFPLVGLIMTKSVVQFFNDDLKDFYGNFNGVTSQVVNDLIHKWYVNNTVQIEMGTAETSRVL